MEKYRIDTNSKGEMEVSTKSLNGISEELIADASNEAELEKLLMNRMDEQAAKKEAWKLAYKDIPLPPRGVPLETMKELSEKRAEIADMYPKKIITGEIKIDL